MELSDEGRLIVDLLKRRQLIGRNGRPKKNSSEPLKVDFGLALVQMELDEKRKFLKTSMWSKYVSYWLLSNSIKQNCTNLKRVPNALYWMVCWLGEFRTLKENAACGKDPSHNKMHAPQTRAQMLVLFPIYNIRGSKLKPLLLARLKLLSYFMIKVFKS